MKYKCIKDWKRVSKGTEVDEYEYRRFPQEIKETHFVRVEDEISVEVVKIVEDNPIKYGGTANHLDITVNFTDPTPTQELNKEILDLINQPDFISLKRDGVDVIKSPDPEKIKLPTVSVNKLRTGDDDEENTKKYHKKFGNKKDTL